LEWRTANPYFADTATWWGWPTQILSREECLALAAGGPEPGTRPKDVLCGVPERVIAKRLHEFFVEHPELSHGARLDLCRRLPFVAADLTFLDPDLLAASLEHDGDDGAIDALAPADPGARDPDLVHPQFPVVTRISTVKLPAGSRKPAGGDAQPWPDGAVPAAELNPDQADLITAIALQGAAPAEGVAA